MFYNCLLAKRHQLKCKKDKNYDKTQTLFEKTTTRLFSPQQLSNPRSFRKKMSHAAAVCRKYFSSQRNKFLCSSLERA